MSSLLQKSVVLKFKNSQPLDNSSLISSTMSLGALILLFPTGGSTAVVLPDDCHYCYYY